MAEDEGRSGAGWRRLRRLVAVLAVALVVHVFVLPSLAGARRALETLSDVQPAWLVAGVILEAAAIASYAELTRTLLPAATRPTFRTALSVTMSTLGLSHVVPGGTAVGSSLGYRLLTNAGVRGTDAGFAIATQGIGSAVILNFVLWIGLLVSIPIRGLNPVYGTAAVLGALLLAAVGAAVLLLTKGEARVAAAVSRVADRLPFLDGALVADVLGRVADRLRSLATQPRLLWRAAGWAALNWILDAASLWVFLAAFGYQASLDGLVVSYGLANVLAALPLTPGGLGVVEASLTASLVGFGATRDVALLGVVAYRLLNFWLPIPLGAVAYLSLRVGGAEEPGPPSDKLRRAAIEAEESAPGTEEWALRHGLRVRRRRRG